MNGVRFAGLDVHQDMILAAVSNQSGCLTRQSVLSMRAWLQKILKGFPFAECAPPKLTASHESYE